MMNGLQSLPYWKEYFGNPTGGKLGLLNAIQVRPIALSRTLYSDILFPEYWLLGSLPVRTLPL
jgi:hypothetical protein